jgi:hypothetical protein
MVEVGMAIYIVKKRGGVWTVAASEVLLSFESYSAAIDAAQRAADDLERSKPSQLKTPSRLAVRENNAVWVSAKFAPMQNSVRYRT